MSKKIPISIGETVYHRDIYEHGEAMVVKGITETEILLEGDYSGGTNPSCNKCWVPLKGTSRIHYHAFKEKARSHAEKMEKSIKKMEPETLRKELKIMVDAVLKLTQEVENNKEF